MLTNIVANILQYINVPSYHVVHLKLTQYQLYQNKPGKKEDELLIKYEKYLKVSTFSNKKIRHFNYLKMHKRHKQTIHHINYKWTTTEEKY